MPERTEPFATALVLAAGGSRRLGRPKQLLPFGDGTLLDRALATARASPVAQRVVALGGAADAVRATHDLSGFDVVVNRAHGSGCSSSIVAALAAVDRRCEVLVLLLGDQPGVRPETVAALLDGRGDAPLAVCRYANGRGHPFAFASVVFDELAALHGDKGVWKLLDRRALDVEEIAVAGPVPRDVDTWDDYEAVLAAAGLPAPAAGVAGAAESLGLRPRIPSEALTTTGKAAGRSLSRARSSSSEGTP